MPDVTANYEMRIDFIAFGYFVFSYIIDDYLCRKCCISIKYSLIVYLINLRILKQRLSEVTATYGTLFDFLAFWVFLNII